MPIIVPENLPAGETLRGENIFVMKDFRARRQDIRPLKIALVNLMPNKHVTETQLLRLLSNFPLQIEIDLISTKSYESKNTPPEHLKNFYKNFADIRQEKFDGMIITGAPVEKLRFSEVKYWDEFTRIMDFSRERVTSTLHICWAAQAALYYHYRLHNFLYDEKLFGVFKHSVVTPGHDLVRGFDDEFLVPHSRWSDVDPDEMRSVPDLEILAESPEAGFYLAASKDGKFIFINGHSEYDYNSLKQEYDRDVQAGLPIKLPCNYYPNDDPAQRPVNRWKSHANLLFANWLNYFVYQVTPYNLEKGKKTSAHS